jgi:hypothetical protein
MLDKADGGLDTERRAAIEMKMLQRRLWLPAAAFAVASALPVFLPTGWISARAWKGYFTVRFEESPKLARLLPELSRQPGVLGVASRYTTRVAVNTFSGYEPITVGDLSARLDPADPRLDPYLRSVANYFGLPGQGDLPELAYVRTERRPLALALILKRLLAGSGVRFRILEFDPLSSLVRVSIVAAAAFLLIRRMPRLAPRGLLWLGALPWLWRAAAGDTRDMFAFFFLYPLWLGAGVLVMNRPLAASRKARSRRRRRKARPSFDWARIGPPAVLAGAGLAALLLAAPGIRHLPGSVLAVAADLCLLALLPQPAQSRRPQAAHRLFRAVPILSSRAGRTGWRYTPAAWALPALLAALPLAAVPLLRLIKLPRDQVVPCLQQSAAGSRSFSWASLSRLPLSRTTDELPHLADYVAHRAFQESLIFSRPYGLPRQDERLYLSTSLPVNGGNRIMVTSRVVKRFSDSWLRVSLASAPPGSLQRLLLDQGGPGQVRWCRETGLAGSLKPLARGIAATLFLLILVSLEELGLTAAGLSGKRSFAP